MKKTLALVLSFLLCFGLSMNTFAEEGVNDQQDDIISLEELQNLFPQVALGDDGYIVSNSNSRSSDISNIIEDLQYVEDNISEPIQSYSADYNGGTCTLNIYDNDMYNVFGYEEVPTANTRGAGYESLGGSQYRSYYRILNCGFYYTYKHSVVSGLSTLSNLGSQTWPTLGTGGFYTITSGDTGYIRTLQNGSTPAQVYGNGTFNSSPDLGYPYSMEYKLITSARNGNISVEISTP